MSHRRFCLMMILAVWIAAWLVAPAVAQQGGQTQRDPKEEQAVLDRLAQINPDAVPIFEAATQAMDAGSLQAAQQGYEKVLALAPGFPDAERRLSYVETRLGNLDAAIQHARAAVAADPSSYNESALAMALLSTKDAQNNREGLDYARSAVQKLPDDAQANTALLLGGIYNNDTTAIRQASGELVVIAPDQPIGHYFNGLVAADDGQWEKAEQELLLSQQLGLPAADVQQALSELRISEQASQQRALRLGASAVLGWVGLGIILFVAGIILSRGTMAAVHRYQSSAQFSVGTGERRVRNIYRIVIALTSVYFYVSIPFVIVLVIAGAVGIFYLFLSAGRIPIQLTAALALAVIYTLIAIVRAVFTRIKESEPGRPLTRAEAPQLWSLVEIVARRLETRPVDMIYITPGTDMAVTERGGIWKKLRGTGQRCLILGLGVLPGMNQGQFEAILAHEYGHFTNRDTAGGNLAQRVQVSIHHMAYGLAVRRQAVWYNPAWLFVNGFYRLFLRITLGASRLQEILADRYAALAYGVRNFVDGLTHVVRQNLVFNWQVGQEIKSAQQASSELHNLYTLPTPDAADVQQEIDQQLTEIINRPTSPYDSHPGVKERFELVQRINPVDSAGSNLQAVWDLLPNTEVLQSEMTALVQKRVQQS